VLCLRTGWGAIDGHARNETRSDSRLRVLHGGFHAAGACRHCMLRQGTLLDANSERFNIWRSARIVAVAGRRRRQRERERDVEADQRDCLVHCRGEVSPPRSSHPARPSYVSPIRAKRSRAQPNVAKHSTAAERSRAQRSSSSTAIRSTAQRSEAQHSDPAQRSSTARKRMRGRLWPIKHSRARGVKGQAQRNRPFYVKPTGRTPHSAQVFLTAQNPHNRHGR
jgi:hypothetical protein